MTRSPKIKSLFEPLLYSKNVFFSLKKCGENDCTTCLPKRLPSDIFDQLNSLPNPIPDPYNEGHYAKFNDIYGTETTVEHMAFLHITASKSHGIFFNPLLQHAKNTGLTVKCTECNRP